MIAFMSFMKAHYDGKHFVPDEPVNLPKGTPVMVAVSDDPQKSPLIDLVRLAEQHPITDSPPDWSSNHTQYIRGTSKQ
jgi:hypothetical protein